MKRRELLRLLAAGSAVAAVPALGKIMRAGEPRRADVVIVGVGFMAEGDGQSGGRFR